VELEIYMTWNEERYPLKNEDNIYYDILMVGFLMTAFLAYVYTIQSSVTQIIGRAMFSSTLTVSLEKTHQQYKN
jgi:hypothetical protein